MAVPQQRALVEIGPGFWNIRGSYKILVGLIELGTHMSIAQLPNGKFLIIDAIPLTPQIKSEIDQLTENGAKIEAVLTTHPFHTLAIPGLFSNYPNPPYYGCPRHIKRFPEIQWAGDLNDCKVRSKWNPDVDIRVPHGAEFVAPLPEKSNHFCCAFVYHKQSRTVHVDDTIMYCHKPGHLLKFAGFKEGTMMFHPSIKWAGLLPNREAPFAFRDWMKSILADWDFDNLCTAHLGNKVGGAKAQVEDLVQKAEPLFQKLTTKREDPRYAPHEEAHSHNVDGNECG